jgi:hypothetical protein
MTNLTIYNVHHKVPQWCAHDEVFKPFIVGGETRGGFLSDDWGDNIRDQHSFAEMRCHYHVWQNRIDGTQNGDDYVGFQHYRRQFYWDTTADARLACDIESFQRVADDTASTLTASVGPLDLVADIFAAKRIPAPPLIGEDYVRTQTQESWDAFYGSLSAQERSIADMCNWINPCNMYIMRVDLFDLYMCDWWRAMSQTQQAGISPGQGYQMRTFGFLSERHFTIWLERLRREKPNLRIIELPILIGQWQEPQFDANIHLDSK